MARRIEAAWHGPRAGRGADAGAAARGARLRRHVARFSRARSPSARATACSSIRGPDTASPIRCALPRPLTYMHEEALDVLPQRARPGRRPQDRAGRPQRRRLDRHDLCGRPAGLPRARARADGAAFLRRGHVGIRSIVAAKEALREGESARATRALSPRRGHGVLGLERRLARSRVPRLAHRRVSGDRAGADPAHPGRG